MLTTLKVVTPVLKGLDYYYKLLIRGRVIDLSPFKLLLKESNRILLLSILL